MARKTKTRLVDLLGMGLILLTCWIWVRYGYVYGLIILATGIIVVKMIPYHIRRLG